ncbi:MAG: oligosaccharide flippase family protein [Aggregatilineales bacterium]
MRRVSHNTLILFANNAGGAALAFLISVVIGRGLGQAGLGQYAFVTAWVAPLTMLADFGLGTLITRDAARDKSAAPALLHAANRALPLIAGLTLIGAWIAIPLSGFVPPIAVALALIALLIALDPWYGLYTAAFRAFERMTPIFVVNVGGLAVQLVLTGIAVVGGAGLIGAVGGLVIVNIGQWAVIWGWWRMRPSPPTPLPQAGEGSIQRATSLVGGEGNYSTHRVDSPSTMQWERGLGGEGYSLRTLLRRAAPFALAAVIGALAVRLNVLLIDRLAGDAATGQYSAASRFVEAGRLLPNAAFGALFPALARLSANRASLNRLFRWAMGGLGLLSAALAIGLALTAPLILRLSYGGSFVDAAPVLSLLAWSLIPATARGLVSLYLYSLGREGIVNRIALLALIGQAAIGLISVSAFGATGAALTAILTESGALLALLLTITRINARSENTHQT